jgi:Icc-related predicted phosphoesterase
MKIAVMSDLHLELDTECTSQSSQSVAANAVEFSDRPPQPHADLLIVAGDVHSGALGIDWVLRHFAIPAIVIGGNHEPYGHELFRVIQINRERAHATNGRVTFLERATWKAIRTNGERIRVIGATLWSDFRLYGTPGPSMQVAQERLDDFKVIKIERGYKLRTLRPADTARLHAATLAFLRKELSREFDGTTIVVTHHAPSPRSVAPSCQNDPLNPAFVSDLEAFIERYEPALWIHGHMHDSFDYRVGRTRVVCNPRGYFPDQLNPDFNPLLVLETGEP